MKFEELKRSLNSKIEWNYVLSGKDVFLLDKAYSLILDKMDIQFKELNEIKFNDLEVDFNNVVSALMTPALMSKYKLVYVDISSKHIKLKNIDALKKYFEEDNFENVLIIKTGSCNENLKQFDTHKICQVDCDEVRAEIAVKLIQSEVAKAGKSITMQNAQILLQYCGFDIMMSMNEVGKLTNYSVDEITKDDIELLTNKSFEYKIYDLTESLGKKNVNKVYEILNDLKQKKNGYQGLLALIYSHFRRMLHLSITKDNIVDAANYLDIKEYAAKKCLEQAKYFKPKKLKEINDLCISLEYQIKTSQITPINAVDMLVLNILS